MSWLGIANNQTVSFNNLQDAVTTGYFYALASIPSSLEQITKSDASTYVSIDTAYAPYAAKASNQLVVKSDLLAVFPCGATLTPETSTNCAESYAIQTVILLGGYTSGTVNIDWSFSLQSGYNLNQLLIRIYYNESIVATTGTITVNSGSPNASGSLSFTADGSDNKYIVWVLDPYCY
jgi:hypothetical protein